MTDEREVLLRKGDIIIVGDIVLARKYQERTGQAARMVLTSTFEHPNGGYILQLQTLPEDGPIMHEILEELG